MKIKEISEPRVMVTCVDSWRNDVGANTFPRLFAKWNPDNVAVVYTKANLPDSKNCNNYYQIAENDVLHSFFCFARPVGSRVYREEEYKVGDERTLELSRKESKKEAQRYAFFRKHRLSIFHIARDIMWLLGTWKTKDFDNFIENFNPNVLFFPIYPYVYMNVIQLYIARKTGVRGVAYITDDVYSFLPEWYNPFFILRRLFVRVTVRKLINQSDEILVILPNLKEEYESKFKKPIRVLTKGIDSIQPYTEYSAHKPIRMVYTGNLFIGRDKTMSEIVKAVGKLNKEYGEIRIKLDLYSHIELPSKMKSLFKQNDGCEFKGSVTVTQAEELQKEAEILLFVEALDVINRYKARLSFSTKLTDYFRAGKCILAVGFEGVAPIDYLKRNEAAIVVSDKSQIETALKSIIDNPEIINRYGRAAFELGISNHSSIEMDNIIRDSLTNAAKRSKK